jgi:hypothetical protein
MCLKRYGHDGMEGRRNFTFILMGRRHIDALVPLLEPTCTLLCAIWRSGIINIVEKIRKCIYDDEITHFTTTVF